MRILQVLTYYWPHWTGLTKHVQRLSEGLARRGHQVSVLTSRFAPDLPGFERHEGVAIHRLPTVARISRGVVMPGFPFAASRLIAAHDLVHIHIPLLETWLLGVIARRLGKPLVATNHGDLIMPGGWFNQVVQGTVRGIMKAGLRHASALTTYSDDYAQHSEVLRPFLAKTHAVAPPVTVLEPEPAGIQELRARLGLGEAPVVGFAGRFVEEKGFDYLLQAMPLVAAVRPEVRFAFAGERFVVYENFYQRWARLIEEQQQSRLVLVGLLRDEQEIANFYGMCDALAIPSRSDCFNLVQVEGMLCGVPIVATSIPGLRVAIQRTGAGLLVSPRDPRALADGLLEVLASPVKYGKPRKDIERVFGVEQSLDAYEALFRSVMEERRGSQPTG